MPILPGRMPQMSVKNSTPGNSPAASARNSNASFPIAGISTFSWTIFALIQDGVPVTCLVASGALEAPFEQNPADHPIEVAMRNQGGRAPLPGAGDEDLGGLHR